MIRDQAYSIYLALMIYLSRIVVGCLAVKLLIVEVVFLTIYLTCGQKKYLENPKKDAS